MKKITACVLMICLLGLGTLAYAETPSEGASTDTKKPLALLQQKVQTAKELYSQLQPQIAEIRDNRTEILGLRAEARKAYDAAAEHVKELKENRDNLTDEQVGELKQAIKTLRQYRLELSGTIGNIHTEVLEIRAARREQNIEQIKESLAEIIAIQEERIELLKSSIEVMNRVLEID